MYLSHANKMQINKKLIHFSKKEDFVQRNEVGDIKNTSIVFITFYTFFATFQPVLYTFLRLFQINFTHFYNFLHKKIPMKPLFPVSSIFLISFIPLSILKLNYLPILRMFYLQHILH